MSPSAREARGRNLLAANWKASTPFGGTPGESDSPVIDADTDGDGLNDQVEIGLGTDPTNPDTDFDGMPDGAEVDAGTDPLDAASLFELVSITPDITDSEVTLVWTSTPGKSYRVQYSVDFSLLQWTDLNGGVTITGAPGSETTSFVDDTVDADERRRFYRVVLVTDP